MHYSKEIQERIDEYLDEVSRNIQDISPEEKSDLLQCLREHIDDALSGSGIENPTIGNLLTVIEEMAPAQSYRENDTENKLPEI